MANWDSRELQTPPAIKKIGENAQNVINNLDILLKLVKGGADVAKLFLLLSMVQKLPLTAISLLFKFKPIPSPSSTPRPIGYSLGLYPKRDK